MSVNKQLLDPLGTICKLVSLNFMKMNTKISITNHTINLQAPTSYLFLSRTLFGDGKENISELYNPIIRAIRWYLVAEDDENENDNYNLISKSAEIKRLFKYACLGLKRLQQTYQSGNVVLAIQFYINIFNDAINGNFNEERLPINIEEGEKNYDNLIDYKKLKNFWDLARLKTVCKIYDNCFSTMEDISIYLEQKNAVMEGAITSSTKILESFEAEFQKLICNTNNG